MICEVRIERNGILSVVFSKYHYPYYYLHTLTVHESALKL